jgi:cell division protein FtsQ
VAAVVTLLVLGGAWIWFRNSSLVSVRHVSVRGASGPDAPSIDAALSSAAHTMSTLDVQMSRLRSAVAPYPIVKDLRVSTDFPHGMTIRVVEQLAVGAVEVAGHKVPVAGDGTLLHDSVVASSLPLIPLRVPPGGARVTEPDALRAVRLLAMAPRRMRAKISQVSTVAGHGLVAQLRNGPSLYFGDASRLGAKWQAASEVLADPGSAGAVYIDVTDPGRPAAGSRGSDSSSASSSSTDQPSSASGSGSGQPTSAASSGTSQPTAVTGSTAGVSATTSADGASTVAGG